MSTLFRRTIRPSTRRAFTLIELMVVIGIIIILVGIVLAVGSSLASSSEVSRTRNTMQLLESSLDEWRSVANRELTWGTDGVPVAGARYDLKELDDNGDPRGHVFLVTELLNVIGRSSTIRETLSQVQQERLHRYDSSAGTAPEWIRNIPPFEPDPSPNDWETEWSDGTWDGGLAVLDAWDKPIRFIHPGRQWSDQPPYNDPPADRDEDGTLRTPLEDIYGICQNRRPYFVSSGPDGSFGDRSAAPDSPFFEATVDNIYTEEALEP